MQLIVSILNEREVEFIFELRNLFQVVVEYEVASSNLRAIVAYFVRGKLGRVFGGIVVFELAVYGSLGFHAHAYELL